MKSMLYLKDMVTIIAGPESSRNIFRADGRNGRKTSHIQPTAITRRAE